MKKNTEFLDRQSIKEKMFMTGKIRVSQLRSNPKLNINSLKECIEFMTNQEKKNKANKLEKENMLKIKINNKTFLTFPQNQQQFKKVYRNRTNQQFTKEKIKNRFGQIQSNVFQKQKLTIKLKSYSTGLNNANIQSNTSLKNCFQQCNKISNMGLKIFKMPQNLQNTNLNIINTSTFNMNSKKNINKNKLPFANSHQKGQFFVLKGTAKLNIQEKNKNNLFKINEPIKMDFNTNFQY